MTPQTYTEFLHHNIPLTAAAGVYVVLTEPYRIEIRAPMAPNRNHHGSMFGGSLAMLGIVSGWALVNRALDEAGLAVKLVVQKSECEYLAPAIGEVAAAGELSADDWQAFTGRLRERGRARIQVETQLSVAGQPVVRHHGVFAARQHVE